MSAGTDQVLSLQSTILFVAASSDMLAVQGLNILATLGKQTQTLADGEVAPKDSCVLFSATAGKHHTFKGTFLRTTKGGIERSGIVIPEFAANNPQLIAVNRARLKPGQDVIEDDAEFGRLHDALASTVGYKTEGQRSRKRKTLSEVRAERNINLRYDLGLAVAS